MKYYNLYYKNECVNTKPLSFDELQNIVNNSSDKKVIYKYNALFNKLSTIDRNKIRVVECTIV